MRTAVVIGSSGLIGQQLVEKLAQEGSWSSVLAITRKNSIWNSPKIRNLRFDFINWADLEMQIQAFGGGRGIDFFCCLGTTIKQAKSEAAFKKIDLEAVVLFSKLASRCRAEQLIVVSAMAADANSSVFYNRVKGEMEQAVPKEFSGKIHFMRPSLLLGDRKEFRFAERVAILLAPIYASLIPVKYKPILASCVAKAMVALATKKATGDLIVDNAEMHQICG